MTQTVTLTEPEQRLARYLARLRYAASFANGVHAPLHSGEDELKNELESFGAEIAYCKIANCYPDLQVGRYREFDAVVGGGARVDVKQTKHEWGRLIVSVKARGALPDYYALMIGTFPTYRLAGHIPACEVLREERIDKTLKHPAYTARQEELVELITISRME